MTRCELAHVTRQTVTFESMLHTQNTSVSVAVAGAVLTWAAFNTGGSKVVLPMWVRDQLVQVRVVAHEARARVLTHPVVLKVPTGLPHKE